MPDQSRAVTDSAACQITTHWHGSTVIIRCAGALDMLTAPELRRHLVSVLGDGPTTMIADLTSLTFLASHGIGVLIETQDLCAPAVRFAVVARDRAALRPLELTKVTDLVSVHDTVERALAATAAPPSQPVSKPGTC